MFEVAAFAFVLLVELSTRWDEPAMAALERVEAAMPSRTSRMRDRVEFALVAGGEIR